MTIHLHLHAWYSKLQLIVDVILSQLIIDSYCGWWCSPCWIRDWAVLMDKKRKVGLQDLVCFFWMQRSRKLPLKHHDKIEIRQSTTSWHRQLEARHIAVGWCSFHKLQLTAELNWMQKRPIKKTSLQNAMKVWRPWVGQIEIWTPEYKWWWQHELEVYHIDSRKLGSLFKTNSESLWASVLSTQFKYT